MRWKSIQVIIKPNKKAFKIYPASEDLATSTTVDCYILEVTAVPVQNRCNNEIIKGLAEYFNIEKYQVRIVKGQKNRTKYVQIYIEN